MRNVKKMLALLFGVLLLISCKNHNVHVMPANCDTTAAASSCMIALNFRAMVPASFQGIIS